MSTAENKLIARRFLTDVWEKGDRAAAEEIVATDVVVHGGSVDGQPPGPAGQLYAANFFRASFPNFHWTLEDIVAEGDKVVYRWIMAGAHLGALDGASPTGKQVTWTGIDFLRIEHGKIVDIWHNEDYFGLLLQLGFTVNSPPEQE